LQFPAAGIRSKEKSKEEEAIPVRVMKVELKDIQNTLDYVGDIKAEDESHYIP